MPRAVRSTVTRVAHTVRSAGAGLHVREWATMCGWRFGLAPHEVCDAEAVNCRRCLAFGGGSRWGAAQAAERAGLAAGPAAPAGA